MRPKVLAAGFSVFGVLVGRDVTLFTLEDAGPAAGRFFALPSLALGPAPGSASVGLAVRRYVVARARAWRAP